MSPLPDPVEAIMAGCIVCMASEEAHQKYLWHNHTQMHLAPLKDMRFLAGKTIGSGQEVVGFGHQPMRELVASIFSLILKGTVPDSTVLDE